VVRLLQEIGEALEGSAAFGVFVGDFGFGCGGAGEVFAPVQISGILTWMGGQALWRSLCG
jgi:hypothetical protein